MVNSKRHAGPVLGAVVTTVLLLSPVPYGYAPILGGLLAGGLRGCGVLGGARAGVEIGVITVVGTTLIAMLAATGSVSAGSSARAYAVGMAGSGPRNLIFYAVFAYSYAMYATLVGVVVGSIPGGVRARGE